MSDARGGRFHVDKPPKGGAMSDAGGGDFTWISAAIHRVCPQFGRARPGHLPGDARNDAAASI